MAKEKSVRLDRLLSNLGYGSRKEMTMAVKNGWVDVDGERVTDPGFSVAPEMVREGRVLLDGEKLDPLPPLNIMLNKPAGVTSSHKDPGKVVYDLLPERYARRSPKLSIAGRLDKDSTGLVILTDDGGIEQDGEGWWTAPPRPKTLPCHPARPPEGQRGGDFRTGRYDAGRGG